MIHRDDIIRGHSHRYRAERLHILGDFMEIWKAVPGYPDYEVSSYGQVRSFKRDKSGYILSQRLDKKGYCHVAFNIPGGKKDFQTHRLVLLTFCPNENASNLEVNHKDENKQNNHLDNLEWLTHKENVNYGTGKERSSQAQRQPVLCEETGIVYDSLRSASEQTGINAGNISSCCSGRLATAGGYHWKKIVKNN